MAADDRAPWVAQTSAAMVLTLFSRNIPVLAPKGLTHWGRDEMAATLADDVFKCIFLNENVWILIDDWILFVRVQLTIF